MTGLAAQLDSIKHSLSAIVPEALLVCGIVVLLVTGLIRKNKSLFTLQCFLLLLVALVFQLTDQSTPGASVSLFSGMLQRDTVSSYFKILFTVGGLLTVFMTWRNQHQHAHLAEYYALLLGILLGAHLLVMSTHFIMVFLSLELMSICAYAWAGFSFTKKSAEGSLKYFLFGSVASAVMLYGFSLLYGLTGTLDFSSEVFFSSLIQQPVPLFLIAGIMSLVGFLYKIATAPLHAWSPDVYESAPMPVVAFFSVVPKLAGLGVFMKFILALNLFGQSPYDWQMITGGVAILSLTIGNFSALRQTSPKRMMAYSSIAQSGFLLIGITAFLPQGIQFMLFYASIYLLMNFLIFNYLQYAEQLGLTTLTSFSGSGKYMIVPALALLVGFVALTGLPPTAGFTGKLFIFSALWESYALTQKPIVGWLLIFGLLNTVVSLFYYLRIPYYAFIKTSSSAPEKKPVVFENLFGLLLVFLLISLFFVPGMLMGWINKITFVP